MSDLLGRLAKSANCSSTLAASQSVTPDRALEAVAALAKWGLVEWE